MAATAKVVSVQGEVFARSPNGIMRRLGTGDSIEQGEIVISSVGGAADLVTADGQKMSVHSQESFQFGPEASSSTAPGAGEAAVAATAKAATVIEQGEINFDELDAAAAGLGGGGENGGNSFVRLMRISEELTPLDYAFQDPAAAALLSTQGVEGPDNGLPTAGNLTINLDEDDISYVKSPNFWETTWYEAFSTAVGDSTYDYENGNSDVAPGDDVPDPTLPTISSNLNFSYGPDGMGTLGGLVFNLPAETLTSGGETVHYWMAPDGHTLVGYTGEIYVPQGGYERLSGDFGIKVIFSAEITNAATGAFTFTQYGPLDHPNTDTNQDNLPEDNLIIPFGFTVTDATGDSVVGTLTLNLDDDSPVLPEASHGVLLIPELEGVEFQGGNLAAALSDDAKEVIHDFVMNGGNLVINGSDPQWSGAGFEHPDEALINSIFGFSIRSGSTESYGVPTFGITAAADGTPFAGGPALLDNSSGTFSWSAESLPPGAQVMYSDGDNAAVVVIPVGSGQITFLAYDWFDAAPVGEQDGGWLDVLNTAVTYDGAEIANISVFDNSEFVDSSDDPDDYYADAESDNIQATLTAQGHVVTTFTGISAEDIASALPPTSAAGYTATIAENDIDTKWSEGTTPDDDFDDDTSYTGDPSYATGGPAYIFGSLMATDNVFGDHADLVNFGADGMGSYGKPGLQSFSFTEDAIDQLVALGLSSWNNRAVPLTKDDFTISEPDEGGWVTLTAREPDIDPSGATGTGKHYNSHDTSNDVFELRLNQNTGEYEFRLFDELMNKEGVTKGNVQDDFINLPFGNMILATDGDGDSVTLTGAFNIQITDDGPVATAKEGTVTRTLDETYDWTDKIYASELFKEADFGADHKASETYKLSAEDGAPTGLFLTGSEVEIKLVKVSDTLFQGREGGAEGKLAFTVSVDASSGEVTIKLINSLDHPDPDDHDDMVTLGASIQVVQTLTDTDGDTAVATSKPLDIRFEDDGPYIDVRDNDSVTTVLKTLDAETIGEAFDVAVSTAKFGGEFRIAIANYGADGPGALSPLNYRLGLSVNEGSSSGLYSDESTVRLWQLNDGTIVGATGSSTSEPSGTADARVVFSLSVDGDGKVTLTQYREIDHPNNNDTSAPYDNQFVYLPNDKVTLTASATITDGDGDRDSDSATIDLGGNIGFADDGPSITVVASNEASVLLTTQDAETIGANSDTAASTANFSDVFSITRDYGADGPGTTTSLSYALGLYVSEGTNSGMTINGTAIKLYESGGVIKGSTATSEGNVSTSNTVFTLSVNSSGVVTLTQLQEIDHALPGSTSNYDSQLATLTNGLVKLTATATVWDEEGDRARDSETIDLGGNISFADDGPSVSANATVQFDDEGLLGGIAGGPGDVTGTPTSFSGTLGHSFGADGAGSIGFAAMHGTTGTVGTETVTYGWSGNTLTATGPRGPLFTVEVTDPVTGAYTVTQLDNVLHTPPTLVAESVTLNWNNHTSLSNVVGISVSAPAAGATLINNDGAFGISSAAGSGGLYDEINYSGTSGNSEIMRFELQNDAGEEKEGMVATSATVNLTEFYGNEGSTGNNEAGSYSLYLNGVQVQGPTTFVANSSGGQFVLSINGPASGFDEISFSALPYTVSGGSTQDNSDYSIGSITFNLTPAYENDASAALTYTVTDGDGDKVNGTLNLAFDDDMPFAATQAKTVDVPQQDTNLMIVLDVSGSMDGRLALAKTAISDLIDRYDAYGDVAVKLVTFADTAQDKSAAWMTADDALNLLNSISTNGWTNYDAALAQAMTAWNTAGRIESAQNVSYFLSDGEPNENDGNTGVLANNANGANPGPDTGIQPAEEATWTSFLNANDIKAYALGIGSGLDAADKAYLDPVAYDGTGAGSPLDAMMVPDLNNLSAVLQSTVPAAASGNLLTGTVPSSFGADGGYVSSISVGPDGDVRTFTYDPATDAVTASGTGGSTHLFNAAENQLTVMTEQGGKFIVDLDDGQYSYAPPVNVTGNSVTETVGFVLTDGDKDISSPGQLTLTVNLDSGALEVQGTSSANTITGTAVDEIISGLGGGDTLSGSGGDDWLSGGSSGDALLGGKGSDQLYGGSGGDTFKWALGDASEANTVDTITDFSKANGDVLDLKDLLQGESGLATLLGSPGVAGHENLNSFLTFAHEGANTVLTVDANGSTTGGDAQKVVFENTDLFNQFSATDSADLVNKMLQSGNLKTDV